MLRGMWQKNVCFYKLLYGIQCSLRHVNNSAAYSTLLFTCRNLVVSRVTRLEPAGSGVSRSSSHYLLKYAITMDTKRSRLFFMINWRLLACAINQFSRLTLRKRVSIRDNNYKLFYFNI